MTIARRFPSIVREVKPMTMNRRKFLERSAAILAAVTSGRALALGPVLEEEKPALLRVTGMTKEDASALLLKRLESELENESAAVINKYASLKILALAFLLMIGTLLTAEALEFTVPKAFVYFAMFFSLFVELVQIRYERNVEKHAVAEGGESA